MVKLCVVLAIAGAGSYYAYAKVLRPPEKRACSRLVSLCHSDARDDEDSDDDCDSFFSALKKNAPDQFTRTASCVEDSRSCGQAVGCVAGGAVNLGAGFVRDFAHGLDQSLRQ